MKENLSRMLRSGVALLLAFCMVAGFFPTAAFAQETSMESSGAVDPNMINYVSIGDSMTNGYGFVGYNQDEHTDDYDFLNDNGVYGTDAYPLQFEEYLVGKGYSVNHTKLALSGLRAENMLYLLGITDTLPADGYNVYHGYSGYVDHAILNDYYQNALKEADVISLALGNASFNAYVIDRAMRVFGAMDQDFDEANPEMTLEDGLALLESEEEKQLVLQAYDILMGKLEESIPADMMAQFEIEGLCDLAAYTTASFIFSYKAVIEWIGENNPDAEVILVGILNSNAGMTISGPGFEFDLGSAMSEVYGAVNAYIAALPTVMQEVYGQCEGVTFYYAAQPSEPEMIATVVDELYDARWGVVDRVDGPTVQTKTNDAYYDVVAPMVAPLLTEKGITGDTATLVHNIIYGGLEASVAESLKSGEIELNAIATFVSEEGMTGVFSNAPFSAIKEVVDASMTQGDVNAAVANATNAFAEFFSSEEMLPLVRLFAMNKVGNGISAHPTPATHDRIAASVIAAYGEGYTAKDETIKNVQIVLDELYTLVETYGPEVAAQVWAQWEEYGYVEAVETTMSELKLMLTQRYTYYTETALPAIETAIDALSAEKDNLSAELVALKAELEAKKAELEDAVNGIEIGSVHTPNIDIDTGDLGGNEETEVPENDCTVDGESIEAELEAAVKDLEHAIAVIEALIADIEADIADMIAVAEQIAAAVAELEKTMSDVAAAVEDLEAAVMTVINVVKNSDGVVDQLVNSFEAARDTANAAAKVLDLTIGTAETMMADIDVMIEKIAVDAEDLYNKFVTELPGCIQQIPEEALMLIGGSVMLAQQAYEDNKAEINATLQAELAALAEEYAVSEEEIVAELTKLAEEYGISEESIQAELAAIDAKIADEVSAKYAEIEADYNAQIEAVKAEANVKLAALEAELLGYQTELAALAEDAAEEVKAGIQAQIDRVNADIETVNADLACAVEHLENAALIAYNDIVAEVTKAYEAAIAELEKAQAELKAAYDEAVAVLEQKLAELKAAYDKAVEDLTAAADQAIAELTEALNKQLEELGKIGETLEAAVGGILDAIRQELVSVQVAIEEILKGNLQAVEDLKNALAAMGLSAVSDAIDALIAAVMVLVEEATTADLVIDDDFKYVAIGDGAATTESYVEMLAAALNAEAAENGVDEIEVVNNAFVGNTVTAECENLSDVADADLITVGFSNVEFLTVAINNALNGVELDWAAAVGAENVQYVDELLAEVALKIAEAGIEGEYAEMANAVIESYAYSAVLYATELPALIQQINAVNPDALVIIVGMYNPLDDVVISLDANTTMAFGEYIDYLVEGVAVHGVAYSILTGNSIYVDAPAVDTVNTKTELGIFDLMVMIMNGFESLYPSAAGDDYIAAEIADALNITYVKSQPEVLYGDVNGDGEVNLKDVNRLRKYLAGADVEINMANADVNGDGEVTLKDLARMRKYFAGADVALGA